MKQTSKKRRLRSLIAGLLLLLLALWCLWGNGALMASRITVCDPRLPEAFHGYRIVHLSDLHNARFGEDHTNLVRLIEAEQPSIIVMTGDMIDSRQPHVELTLALAEKLTALAPVYYVTGNHEARIPETAERLIEGLRERGVRVLRGETVELTQGGASIGLTGVDDLGVYYRDAQTIDGAKAALSEALAALVKEDGYTILLSHRPELVDLYAESGACLALCGHAHGGQIRLPGVGGLFAPGQGVFPTYDAGLYEESGMVMVVSRGLGNSTFPLRINNRPEIVTVQLMCRARDDNGD